MIRRFMDYIAQHKNGTPEPIEEQANEAALDAYFYVLRMNYHLVRDAEGDIIAWPKAKPGTPRGGTWAVWRYAQMDPDIIAYRTPRGGPRHDIGGNVAHD